MDTPGATSSGTAKQGQHEIHANVSLSSKYSTLNTLPTRYRSSLWAQTTFCGSIQTSSTAVSHAWRGHARAHAVKTRVVSQERASGSSISVNTGSLYGFWLDVHDRPPYFADGHHYSNHSNHLMNMALDFCTGLDVWRTARGGNPFVHPSREVAFSASPCLRLDFGRCRPQCPGFTAGQEPRPVPSPSARAGHSS